MPLQLLSRRTDSMPLDVSEVSPQRLRDLSLAETRAFAIRCGRRTHSLRDFFEVSGSANEDGTIEFQGDLDAVHGIGATMAEGTMIVHGNAGRHVGGQMTGGELIVHGNVSDYVGSCQSGGRIHIHGSAADWAAGAKSDQDHGMRGGELIIRGSAGQYAGSRMRRGLLVVCGDCGTFLAENMLAGTIVLGGVTNGRPGIGMRRGTIVLLQPFPIPPFFEKACDADFYVLRLLEQKLKQLAVSLIASPADQWTLFHGDQTNEGKGELFVAASAAT